MNKHPRVRYLLFFLLGLLFLNSCELSPLNKDYGRTIAQYESSGIHLARAEHHFYQELRLQTNQHLADIENSLTAPEKKALTVIKEKVLVLVKSFNPIEHVKHLLLTSGTGAAITAAVTELVTVGILPPVLLSLGLPELAALSMGSPTFAVTVPIYMGWAAKRQKKKLARELGFESLNELDKLKKEILGFSLDSHLHSVIFQSLEGDHEVDILKRSLARFRKRPKGWNVELLDLEDIAKKHLEREMFEAVGKIGKEEPRVYSYILLQKISENPMAERELFKLMQKRVKWQPLDNVHNEKRELLIINEKLTILGKYETEARKLKKGGAKVIKANSSRGRELIAFNEFSENLSIDIKILERDINRFQYSYLDKIQRSVDVSNEGIADESSLNAVARLNEIQHKIKRISYHIEQMDKERPDAINNLAGELEKFNDSWSSKQIITPKKISGCSQSALQILRFIGIK